MIWMFDVVIQTDREVDRGEFTRKLTQALTDAGLLIPGPGNKEGVWYQEFNPNGRHLPSKRTYIPAKEKDNAESVREEATGDAPQA